MKAKEWYKKFESCETEEQFQQKLEACLLSLVEEANELISKRRCKSPDAMAACINEVNTKWFAIKRIHDKNKKNKDWHHPILSEAELLEDGFKAVYVHFHPKNSWFFDINKHKKMIDEKNEEIERRKKKLENFTPYAVTPFEQLTMDNLVNEIFCCITALGQYADVGIPVQSLKSLAQRIELLRYWSIKGEINLKDVEEFNKDKRAWLINHGMI